MVTGAAQGLGAAIARRLAHEGAQVLLTDINDSGAATIAAEINNVGGRKVAFSTCHDVAREQDWLQALNCAQSYMGGLSVLVNNAGVLTNGSVESLSVDQWHRDMSTNLDSVFLGTKHALPLMRQSQPGSIINISSIAALIASHNFASYNASKAAVWMLTKSTALHCARHGWDIRSNSVHPAFIRTPILEGLMGKSDPEQILAKLRRQVPLGRLGEPDDVAHAVVYLASDESRFMTAAELKLDGGISAM